MFRIAMFMVLLTACSGKDDAKDVGDSDSQVTAVDDDGDGFTDDIEPRPAFHHTQLAEPVAACLPVMDDALTGKIPLRPEWSRGL